MVRASMVQINVEIKKYKVQRHGHMVSQIDWIRRILDQNSHMCLKKNQWCLEFVFYETALDIWALLKIQL